jgi:hypothetical protein
MELAGFAGNQASGNLLASWVGDDSVGIGSLVLAPFHYRADVRRGPAR